MLFEQDILRAASRAACTAGNSKPTRIPIIAITTRSSTRVNARRLVAAENRLDIFIFKFFLIDIKTNEYKKRDRHHFRTDSTFRLRCVLTQTKGFEGVRAVLDLDFDSRSCGRRKICRQVIDRRFIGVLANPTLDRHLVFPLRCTVSSIEG